MLYTMLPAAAVVATLYLALPQDLAIRSNLHDLGNLLESMREDMALFYDLFRRGGSHGIDVYVPKLFIRYIFHTYIYSIDIV